VKTNDIAVICVLSIVAVALAAERGADERPEWEDPPATQPSDGPARPTPRALERWLGGKEVVEVCFAGPHMEPLKLRDSLKTKISPNDWDFRLTPGEGGGLNRSFVQVCMKVTPDNAQRLLSLQAELEPRGYRLEPQTARVWSYQGGAQARQEARRLVPVVLTAAERAIKQALPKVRCAPERRRRKEWLGGIKYEVPGTNVRGMIHVHEISAAKAWSLAVIPDEVVHLPRLGLMVTAYYRPGQLGGGGDVSPEHASIRKSVREAVGPLVELEAATPAATQPAEADNDGAFVVPLGDGREIRIVPDPKKLEGAWAAREGLARRCQELSQVDHGRTFPIDWPAGHGFHIVIYDTQAPQVAGRRAPWVDVHIWVMGGDYKADAPPRREGRATEEWEM